ncbi:hypothetical protein L1049_001212 [Liquidambar formosana]|uniref:Uncharacterized protein n=1 Tax=Liquidambar formosana TaxID=63359 RepID=A0AAP0NB41_LIQFO
MREYIPCLDNVEAIQKLKSTEKGKRFAMGFLLLCEKPRPTAMIITSCKTK